MRNRVNTKLLDSLTAEQRKQIAEMIRSANIEGDYYYGDDGSVWGEDTAETLESLALEFETYDPESAI